MHIKYLKKYYFIKKFNRSHLLNLNKNISFIWRNKDKQTHLKTLIELRDFCRKNHRAFYISNDIKLAIKIRANGVYIPSSNKSLDIRSIKFNTKFKVLGSAHNIKEIKIKELQNIKEIFLSPLFKSNKNPELSIYRYLNLKKNTPLKDIALGGINHTNIKRLKFVKPFGFAAISFFDKKKGP